MQYQVFKSFNKVLVAGVAFMLLLTVFNSTSYAAPKPVTVCNWDSTSGNPPLPTQIICPIIRAVNVIVLLSGAVFTVMVLVGSYKYATSLGDPKGAMGASATLTHAVMGLLLVIGAYVMLNIIYNTFGLDRSIVNPMNPFEAINHGICNLIKNSASKPLVTGPGLGCP